MLPSKSLICARPNLFKQLTQVAFYSRKSDSKNSGYYRVLKSNDVIDDSVDSKCGTISNWELFAPKGYRFVLPGSIGPAWHEAGSMVPLDNFHRFNSSFNKIDLEELECTAQECPILLRKGVLELFPNIKVYASQQLTVVTLSHVRNQSRHESSDLDPDPEYYAKTFIWAAQEICLKLKATGYWADFINPFSGRPYITPYHKSTLYETDERFRCIGFEIWKKGNCKIIEFQKDNLYVGSLFTNAPPNTELLYDILNEN